MLLKVLNHHCALPPLVQSDKLLNKQSKCGSRRQVDTSAVETRTILRGAAMDALVTAAEGNESILASSGALNLLISPWTYFCLGASGKEEQLAASILNGTDERIPTYTRVLAEHLLSNKTLLPSFDEHASLIREKVFGHNPPSIPKAKSKQPRRKKACRARKLKDCGPTSIKAILPSNLPLSLLPIAGIMREACNRSRGLLPADNALFRVLTGRSLISQQSYPPEQTDPIRGDNAYTKLLLEILPPEKLTTRQGASALLAYMGTGQCTETQGFLRDNKNIFWELERSIVAFGAAKSHNDSVYSSHPAIKRAEAAGRKPKKFITGMIRYEFSQVWGQPCCHLSVRDGIRERFEPMFELEIMDKWEAWLGPLLNKNPILLTDGERRPWKEALDFVQGLGIKGFTSGLTSLQFANNLWVAKIVADPSPDEMVSWLWANRDLGATRGLVHLGFQLKTFKDFHAAFLIVYGHLNEHLSTEDKNILHFSVIFVEHLLCKVSRWGVRLGSHKHLNSKISGEEWSRGGNHTNNLAFPVPEIVHTQCLDMAVDKVNVCALQQPPIPIQALITQQSVEHAV